MKTPIVDFVREYAQKNSVRLHMPGHKGIKRLGVEHLDITEIDGADVLYSPDGIILESENNATQLFGTGHTFYSTEGSTLCIKAMLAIATANRGVERPLIVATRNSHKAFIYACALLDLDVEWIYPKENSHLCECIVTPQEIEISLDSLDRKPAAVYVTSPDYLGNILDIKGLADVCHAHKIPLLVDNAHGAYLNFLPESMHPISLGADMCCDSAHKTLPVLTGGAYLHISKDADQSYCEIAREKLSLFASTSPSYLILQSLDMCNAYLCDGYREKLARLCKRLRQLCDRLADKGYIISAREPAKILIDASKALFSGTSLAKYLRAQGIEFEFSDSDCIVMMFTPDNSDGDIDRVERALSDFDITISEPAGTDVLDCPKKIYPQKVMSIREAIFAPSETVCVKNAAGRVCATPTVSCPPAVPIVVSGEVISADHIRLFEHYGIEKISVVK